MSERDEKSLDEALMRRISEALDRGGLDADPVLRARVEGDPEALRYAQDLVRIDEALASFGRDAPEPDWEALAMRIERHLDDELEPLEGFDAPPRFTDEDEVSRTIALEERGNAPSVVELASRRTSLMVWSGGLAAAAVALLAVMAGGVSFDATPESAGAPMEEEPAAFAEEFAEEALPAPVPEASPDAWESPRPLPEDREARASAEGKAALGLGGSSQARSGRRAERRRTASSEPPRVGFGGDAVAQTAPSEASDTLRSAGRSVAPSALTQMEARVQRCLAPGGASARVTIDVGASGEVRRVRVGPPHRGEGAACIEQAVRSVRLEPGPEARRIVRFIRPPAVGESNSEPVRVRGRRSSSSQSAADHTAPLGGLDGL